MISVLVFGAGQLGSELGRLDGLADARVEIVARTQADIADADACERIVLLRKPDVVVNAAAYTAVDRAESESRAAYAANMTGAANVARAAAECASPVIHISTDYVYDGSDERPWREDDPVGPLNVYGASKFAGELAVAHANPRHVTLRTSWLYSSQGSNFLTTMLRLSRERRSLDVVDDLWGRPTSTTDLSSAILHIARALAEERDVFGVYNYSNGGEPTTWRRFSEAIFAQSDITSPPEVRAIPSDAYPTAARRPRNSVLDLTKFESAFDAKITDWRVSLAAVIEQMLQEREISDR